MLTVLVKRDPSGNVPTVGGEMLLGPVRMLTMDLVFTATQKVYQSIFHFSVGKCASMIIIDTEDLC